MRLADLSDALPAAAIRAAGAGGETEVSDVSFDSRAAGPGTLFFCVRGASADGHDFAPAVVAAGAAALVVDKRVELAPLIAGGGHERGLRSGTENVPAIVGFGVAATLAAARVAEASVRTRRLREKLESGLAGLGATLFGAAAERLPNTSYFALPDIDGETLVGKLDRAGFAVASGAACSSANPEPSHVLSAMRVLPEIARGAVRVSLGQATTEKQIEDFLNTLRATAVSLHELTAMTA